MQPLTHNLTSDASTGCKAAKTGRGEAVIISILLTVTFEPPFKNLVCVALKPLVSLFRRLVAHSGRKCDNTDGRTDGQTNRNIISLVVHMHQGLTIYI